MAFFNSRSGHGHRENRTSKVECGYNLDTNIYIFTQKCHNYSCLWAWKASVFLSHELNEILQFLPSSTTRNLSEPKIYFCSFNVNVVICITSTIYTKKQFMVCIVSRSDQSRPITIWITYCRVGEILSVDIFILWKILVKNLYGVYFRGKSLICYRNES